MAMGLDIVIDGDASANNAGFIPPLTDSLEYWNFFGGTEAANRNLAPGKSNGTLVGAPVANAHSHLFRQGVNYIRTGVPETYEMTFVAIAKSRRTVSDSQAGDEYIISNYQASGGPDASNTGSSLMFRNRTAGTNTYQQAMLTTTNSGVQTRSVPADIDLSPAMLIGQHTLATKTIKVSATAGNLSGAFTDATIYRSGAFNIGSLGATTPALTVDLEIYFAAIFSKYLSTTEITTLQTYLRSYYGRYIATPL